MTQRQPTFSALDNTLPVQGTFLFMDFKGHQTISDVNLSKLYMLSKFLKHSILNQCQQGWRSSLRTAATVLWYNRAFSLEVRGHSHHSLWPPSRKALGALALQQCFGLYDSLTSLGVKGVETVRKNTAWQIGGALHLSDTATVSSRNQNINSLKLHTILPNHNKNTSNNNLSLKCSPNLKTKQVLYTSF